MSKFDIVRAWKDEEYRNSLTQEELSQLPENPAGQIELTSIELASVEAAAGGGTYPLLTAGCCNTYNNITCIWKWCSIACTYSGCP